MIFSHNGHILKLWLSLNRIILAPQQKQLHLLFEQSSCKDGAKAIQMIHH